MGRSFRTLIALLTLAPCMLFLSGTISNAYGHSSPSTIVGAIDPEAARARIVEGEFRGDVLPRAIRYGVLLPENYDQSAERYPVLFMIYPGSPESHVAIRRWQQHIRLAWEEGRLPRAIVITPALDMSMYLDPQGRGRNWYDEFAGPFLQHLRGEFRISENRSAFYAAGLSAGGAVVLRLGLKYPESFGGIAALAPGIEAASSIDELTFEDTFWRNPNQYDGVDAQAWSAYNPLNIARENAERIRSSGIAIYIECGDEDSFQLYRGAEIMHRVLMDNSIPHEYRLRLGTDHHVGTEMVMRWQDAFAFLGTQMRNEPREPIVAELQAAVAAVKAEAARNVPENPRLLELRARLFGFSRPQIELETRELERRLEEVSQQAGPTQPRPQ
jgi:hypothetical protein